MNNQAPTFKLHNLAIDEHRCLLGVTNNDNLTDGKAIDILVKSKGWINSFAIVPNNWEQLVDDRAIFYKELTEEGKMDLIIKHMADNYTSVPLQPDQIVTKAGLFLLTRPESFLMLSKMAADGYIHRNINSNTGQPEHYYEIKHEGIIFSKNGGYTEQKLKEDERHKLEMDNLKRTNKKLKNEWWKIPVVGIVGYLVGVISPILTEWLKQILHLIK